MLFNSLHFLIYFPIVLLLYFLIPVRFRWVLLLVAAYYFYATWQVPLPKDFTFFGEKLTNPLLITLLQARYTLLLLGLSVINYFFGIWIGEARNEKIRNTIFTLSVLTNVGILFYYKYYNFFINNVSVAVSWFGADINLPRADVILPLGISFFVFQKIAYNYEVYKRRFEPERNFWMFLVFSSFFPQLIAGPIERPQNLLPQLNNLKPFDYSEAVMGLRQILWGMFKKVVVADRLTYFVDIVYRNPENYHGWAVIVATLFFTFQIYCDFSGYSDIALGTARMMGIHLMTNFRTPYFAKSIQEFWSRWHISLSTWFRDYLYIPMGGNRVSVPRWIFNLFLIFMVSGVWHGANWTFIVWGFIHGVFNTAEALNKKYNYFPFKVPGFLQRVYMFVVVIFAWIFFRAASLSDAFTVIKNMFVFNSDWFNEIRNLEATAFLNFLLGFPLIALLLTLETWEQNERLQNLFVSNKTVRYLSYIMLCVIIAFFGVFVNQGSFIYFQF
ncbi:MAG: MBOAT family protein [Verrucomicrobia bacterium]|nr:MBOAT family protein [Cytophagales bacterium]